MRINVNECIFCMMMSENKMNTILDRYIMRVIIVPINSSIPGVVYNLHVFQDWKSI